MSHPLSRMTNAEIAERNEETARKFGNAPNPSRTGPTMLSWSYGEYHVTWVADKSVPAEVRHGPNGTVVYRGTREECLDWAQSR